MVLGGEFEIGKIAFDWKIKKKRRKEIGEFSVFWRQI